jgi:hypothetical protein
MVDERGAFVPSETTERKQGHMRMSGPAQRELGPESDNQEHRQPFDSFDHAIEQLQAGWIEPVYILSRHQHRPPSREEFKSGEQCFKRPRLLLFRPDLGRRVAFARRYRQMLRDHLDRRVRIAQNRYKQRFELGQLHLRCVLVPEVGGAPQLVQNRKQRAVRVIG